MQPTHILLHKWSDTYFKISYSLYFVLEGGAKEKMTLICACQPWHPYNYSTLRIVQKTTPSANVVVAKMILDGRRKAK